MRKIIAVAISSAFIAVIWTFGSYLLGLSTVAGFLAWSSFCSRRRNKRSKESAHS